MPINVIGVEAAACYMGTKARTVPCPTNVAIPLPQEDVWYPPTTMGTTRLSTVPKPAPTKATTKGPSSVASMPEQIRLNNGNGPDAFSQDSPVWGLGHWSDEIGAAGSATEAEMEQCMGSGAPFNQDS
jgi:hypothetical protein